MTSRHPHRWARCPPSLAWKRPGLPTDWVPVLDQHPEGHCGAAGLRLARQAAVLGRVVLEDALRRVSRAHSLPDDGKAARLNDELKKAEVYGQPMWRQVQAWLDVGNAAAHGKTGEFSEDSVKQMLSGVATFVATELT